jgi:signal transduction histidine kinase
VFWSLALNTAAFCAGSVLTFPDPVERIQGAAFVNAFDAEAQGGRLGWTHGQAEPEALLNLAQRILGEEALSFFETEARAQGKDGYLPDMTPAFLTELERRLAGSLGAATAHAMISQLFGRATVTVEDLMAVATEAAQIAEYSARLKTNQEELTRTARQLREVNEKLTQLSVQKDGFLSQISHELRTPMTSIRAFSEILAEGGLTPPQVVDYGRIIHEEAKRLTRLLDDLLDLSVLENGAVQVNIGLAHLGQMLDRAAAAASQTMADRAFRIERDVTAEEIYLKTDADRLVQVFINLISNARKYCDADPAVLRIVIRHRAGRVTVDFIDNGRGISKEKQGLVFEKFSRLADHSGAGGAGLGLAICREIMANLGGTIAYLPGQRGAAFRVVLPLRFQGGGGGA